MKPKSSSLCNMQSFCVGSTRFTSYSLLLMLPRRLHCSLPASVLHISIEFQLLQTKRFYFYFWHERCRWAKTSKINPQQTEYRMFQVVWANIFVCVCVSIKNKLSIRNRYSCRLPSRRIECKIRKIHNRRLLVIAHSLFSQSQQSIRKQK